MTNLDQIDDFYTAHGYIRMSEPLDGLEGEYLEFHRAGVHVIKSAMAINAKRYDVRGRSKAALRMLHIDLPTPVWGVEVAGY